MYINLNKLFPQEGGDIIVVKVCVNMNHIDLMLPCEGPLLTEPAKNYFEGKQSHCGTILKMQFNDNYIHVIEHLDDIMGLLEEKL